MQDWWHHIANSGAAMLTAGAGAVIGILLDFRRHTWATASLALVSGVFAAYVGTDAVVGLTGLPSNAVAALLGISGRNLIAWLLSASRDPLAVWDRIRGKK